MAAATTEENTSSLDDAGVDAPLPLYFERLAPLDQSIVAHDWLNPRFGVRRVPDAMIQHDARDYGMTAQREYLKRLPPQDGSSAGMSNAQAVMRRIDFRLTAEDDLEPWAVY